MYRHDQGTRLPVPDVPMDFTTFSQADKFAQHDPFFETLENARDPTVKRGNSTRCGVALFI